MIAIAVRINAVRGLLAILCALPAVAQASNQDSVFLGNDAAMASGAVTATTRDASGAWYNPAGLAEIRRYSIDVSATAVVARFISLPGILRTDLPSGTRTADGSFVSILSIPSALAFARTINASWTAGVGLFVRDQDDYSTRVDLAAGNGVNEISIRESLAVTQIAAEYYLGPSFAYKVSDDLSLGFSAYAVYLKGRQWAQYSLEATPAGGGMVQRAVIDTRASVVAYGARLQAGLQWQLVGPLRLGLTIRSPVVLLSSSRESATLNVPQPVNPTPTEPEQSLGFFRPIGPTRVHLALAYLLEGGWVSAEVDFRQALHDFVSATDDSPVFNFRVGTRLPINETLSFGAGLFTDRSFDPPAVHLGSTHVNYYGATAGLELARKFEIKDRPSEPLSVSTTLAVRYALGVGQSAGTRLDPTANPVFSEVPIDVSFHELAVHIGSTLFF